MWRRIHADGCEWEVRVVANEPAAAAARSPAEEAVATPEAGGPKDAAGAAGAGRPTARDAGTPAARPPAPAADDILEFQCISCARPARRVAIPGGTLAAMGDAELRSAYRRALPIGGDHFGRPGKHMDDVSL